MKKPTLSILCLTYNQEKYVKQALESMLAQKTTFQFEILIHDDASTDATVKILRQYQKDYPEIVYVLFEKENQFTKEASAMVLNKLFYIAKGKYISLCEGDDYFTDDTKLQHQVDFLEKNPEYSLCFHPVNVTYEDDDATDEVFPEWKKGEVFTLQKLLKQNFIQTNSVVYRSLKDYSYLPIGFLPGDWYLHIYHARFGKIGFINKVMSTYRRHKGGLWWNSHKDFDALIRTYGLKHLIMYFEVAALVGANPSDKDIVKSNFTDMLQHMQTVLSHKKNKHLENELVQLRESNQTLVNNLEKITSSKFYKLWQSYCSILKVTKLKSKSK